MQTPKHSKYLKVSKIVCLLLAIIISIDLFVQLIKYIIYNPIAKSNLDQPASVTMAGYGPQRQGVITNGLPITKEIEVIEKILPLPKDTTKGMPLFLNAKDLSKKISNQQPKVRSHYLIAFTRSGKIISYDLKNEEEFWSHNINDEILANSPLISLKWGKLYFRTQKKIHSINLDGSDLQTIPLNIEKMIAKQVKLPLRKIPFFCTSAAAGINIQAKKPYLFIGCATGHSYGMLPNVVGHLFAFYLDTNGKFITPLKINSFKTSIRTNDPRTGFNTGIWNSGMGPTLTPDNQILISTGNGPFYPKQKNYGCSVVKIDGNKLQMSRKEDYYSLDHNHFQECLYTNYDLGSSGVAFIEHKSKQYATLIGKDGYLRVFDPQKMPQNIPMKKTELKIGHFIFGQPIIYSTKKNVRIIAHGRPVNQEKEATEKEYFLATDKMIKQIQEKKIFDGKIKDEGCLGFLKREGQLHDRINLYYSGRIRRDFSIIKNNPALIKQIEKMHFFNNKINKVIPKESLSPILPVFLNSSSLGYSINSVPQPLTSKYQLEKLQLYLGTWYYQGHFFAASQKLKSTRLIRKSFIDPIVVEKNNGNILSLKQKNILPNRQFDFCGTLTDKNLTKLKLYSTLGMKYGFQKGWFVGLYDVDEDLNIKQVWRKNYVDNTRVQNSNIAALKSKDGGGIIILPPHVNGFVDRSVIKLVSLDNQEEIASIPFKGRVHFSMPLIVGNQIFIATKKHGIKMFKIQYWSFSNFFPQNSFWLRWFNEQK